MRDTDTLCGQDAEFWYVKAGGTLSNHCTLSIKSYATMSFNKTVSFLRSFKKSKQLF
jgi:hypothetical protein